MPVDFTTDCLVVYHTLAFVHLNAHLKVPVYFKPTGGLAQGVYAIGLNSHPHFLMSVAKDQPVGFNDIATCPRLRYALKHDLIFVLPK